MKIKFGVAVLLFCMTVTGFSAPESKAAAQKDIYEATLRYIFEQDAIIFHDRTQYTPNSAYYIGISTNHKANGRATNVDDAFLHRLSDIQPPVKQYSECKLLGDGMVADAKTGKRGGLEVLRSIHWVDASNVEVHMWNGMLDDIYYLTLKDGKWTFVKREANGLTAWMTNSYMEPFLATFGVKDEKGKNYWDQGECHWISGVEARWKDGRPQMRVRIEAVPPHSHRWWYWWVNQDQAGFDHHLNELADDQYTMVSYSCLVWPDGTRRHYGVWHKLIP